MAEFNADAGPLPNWEAVFVHIEHWAKRLLVKEEAKSHNDSNAVFLLISSISIQR